MEDHFVGIDEMIEIGKGGQRRVQTVMMSRYACYLVIQNADPSKEIVAQGQTYFVIQTRRQELSDAEVEEQRRLAIRAELRTHNTQLSDAAKDAGVIEAKDYAIFQNHGSLAETLRLGNIQILADFPHKKVVHFCMARYCGPLLSLRVSPPRVIAALANQLATMLLKVLNENAPLHTVTSSSV